MVWAAVPPGQPGRNGHAQVRSVAEGSYGDSYQLPWPQVGDQDFTHAGPCSSAIPPSSAVDLGITVIASRRTSRTGNWQLESVNLTHFLWTPASIQNAGPSKAPSCTSNISVSAVRGSRPFPNGISAAFRAAANGLIHPEASGGVLSVGSRQVGGDRRG
jgi:hypothetical protein